MEICCSLEESCVYASDSKICDLSEDKRKALFEFKENFLKHVATSSRIHKVPTEKLEELLKTAEELKRLFYGMYYYSNISLETSNENQEVLRNAFSDMEKAFLRVMKRAELRSITMGKHAVGFFGHFNSGKTSMLNKMLEANFELPVAIKPSTAVPTYIIYSKKDRLVFENMRGKVTVEDDISILNKIKHSENPCGFPWASVINRTYYFCKNVSNPNVVYIDLPGISNDNNDNERAYSEIAGCDAILYLISHGQGSLTVKDIECLKNINKYGIPILIVLTKVDLKPSKITKNIYNKIKDDLSNNNVKYNNFIMYSTKPEKFEKSDKNFYEELLEYQDIIYKFVNAEIKTEEDLSQIKCHTALMYERFDKADDYLRELTLSVNKNFEQYIGEKELTEAFFKRWKEIISQIYTSDTSYITKKIFSQNEFDYNGYISHCATIINNYFDKEADVYSSSLNWSFVQLANVSSLEYVRHVAGNAEFTRETQSSLLRDTEVKYIENVSESYSHIKDGIKIIRKNSLLIPQILLEELSKTQRKVIETLERFEKTYKDLIQIAQQNEKEWSE